MTVVVYLKARYKLIYMVLLVQGVCESSKSTGAHIQLVLSKMKRSVIF